jgi:hypothetical protein
VNEAYSAGAPDGIGKGAVRAAFRVGLAVAARKEEKDGRGCWGPVPVEDALAEASALNAFDGFLGTGEQGRGSIDGGANLEMLDLGVQAPQEGGKFGMRACTGLGQFAQATRADRISDGTQFHASGVLVVVGQFFLREMGRGLALTGGARALAFGEIGRFKGA